MAVPRLYPMLIKARRCLLNPISFSTPVKGLLCGQMWSFCSSIRGVEKRSPRNSRSGLRGARSVFHHQPFRLHLYGIMFIQLYAYVCYADHGCSVYSEPLYFVENIQHAQFLADFLTGFIANPGRRGRDPTVEKENRVYIRHAETTWAELPNSPLCCRPCLIGEISGSRWCKIKMPNSQRIGWL
jgi:hypothetical protein